MLWISGKTLVPVFLRIYPWDYALNEESTSGSMAQLATAVAEKRTDNTILVDAGDTLIRIYPSTITICLRASGTR